MFTHILPFFFFFFFFFFLKYNLDKKRNDEKGAEGRGMQKRSPKIVLLGKEKRMGEM